jgi:hypothetical protein
MMGHNVPTMDTIRGKEFIFVGPSCANLNVVLTSVAQLLGRFRSLRVVQICLIHPAGLPSPRVIFNYSIMIEGIMIKCAF